MNNDAQKIDPTKAAGNFKKFRSSATVGAVYFRKRTLPTFGDRESLYRKKVADAIRRRAEHFEAEADMSSEGYGRVIAEKIAGEIRRMATDLILDGKISIEND